MATARRSPEAARGVLGVVVPAPPPPPAGRCHRRRRRRAGAAGKRRRHGGTGGGERLRREGAGPGAGPRGGPPPRAAAPGGAAEPQPAHPHVGRAHAGGSLPLHRPRRQRHPRLRAGVPQGLGLVPWQRAPRAGPGHGPRAPHRVHRGGARGGRRRPLPLAAPPACDGPPRRDRPPPGVTDPPQE